MQAYLAKLSGTMTEGDQVRLTWYGSRGGRNDCGHHVQATDTIQDVLLGIYNSAKNYLLTDQEVTLREGSLMIMTSRSDGWFGTDVLGAGTEVWSIEKL